MKSLFNFFSKQSPPDDTVVANGHYAMDSSGVNRKERAGLQGDISVVSLDDIFQLFDFAALTGELEIITSTNCGWFYFKQGVLVYGLLESSYRKLGQILVDSNVVTTQQLEECLPLNEVEQQKKIGQLLVDRGHLAGEKLTESLNCQVKEAFFEVLSWKEGTFSYYHDQLPPEEEVKLNERVDHLLLEGMMRFDEG